MAGKKLYCGNLKYSVTNEQLQNLCASYGEIVSVNIIEGKGFGFVEFASEESADKAREGLNGNEFEGRTLRVAEARPPQKRPNFDRGKRY